MSWHRLIFERLAIFLSVLPPLILAGFIIVFTQGSSTIPVALGQDATDVCIGEGMFELLPQMPYATRYLKVNYEREDVAIRTNIFLRCLAQPKAARLRSNVTEILVTGDDSNANWKLLTDGFDGLSAVETVRWHSSKAIPPEILSSLSTNNPISKLYYNLHFGQPFDCSSLDWNYEDGDYPFPVHVPQNRNAEQESVINSKSLHALKASILYGGDENPEDLDLVWKILTSCSNLRELDLSIQRRGGLLADQQPFAFDFASNKNAKLAQLEVLKLDGYRLDHNSSGGPFTMNHKQIYEYQNRHHRVIGGTTTYTNWWRQRIHLFTEIVRDQYENVVELLDFTPQIDVRTNGQAWMQAMNWSNIHTLSLTSPSIYTLGHIISAVDTCSSASCIAGNLSGHEFSLPSLRSLSISGASYHPAAQSVLLFLSYIAPLTSLSLRDVELDGFQHLIKILTSHHPTITHFSLIEREELRSRDSHWEEASLDWPSGRQRTNYLAHPYLSLDQLDELSYSLENLESLDIDIDRSTANATDGSGWNTTLLDHLAQFPRLQHLTLRLESTSVDGIRPSSEHLDTRGDSEGYKKAAKDELLNEASVRELFHQLRIRRPQGQRIVTLEVYSGLWHERNEVCFGPPQMRGYGRWKCGGSKGLGAFEMEEGVTHWEGW